MMLMNDRVHAALDGSLNAAALEPGERAELEAFSSGAAELRRRIDGSCPPLLAERIDMAILVFDRGRLRPLHRWGVTVRECLWRLTSTTFRPAHALAVGAVAIALLAWFPRPGGSPEFPPADTTAPTLVHVRFQIEAPGAASVRLSGSFTGWQSAIPLQQNQPGLWDVVVPLAAGVHDYAFRVDGQWIADPHAALVSDGFGGTNSRLILPAPRQART